LLNLVKALLVLVLLAVPVLVVMTLPRFVELAASVPAPPGEPATPAPAFRLVPTTPQTTRSRLVVDDGPPPTLAPPETTATAVPTPRPTPTGERIVIANTGGRGAVLRAEPVSGRPVAALHEQQVLDVLEHRSVPGSGDWLHVRTAEGAEGWVTSLVAQQAPRSTP
jgi:hypothetical protein